MKNAVILHGTNATSKDNWFPWLKNQLEKRGYKVWVPNLPEADNPNVCNYNPFLIKNYDFNKETVMIGHSSGAVSILGLLNKFPRDKKIDKAILVAGFKDDLGREDLKDLFIYPFNWRKIKSKVNEFVLIHSDDDPHVPLEHGKYLAKKLNGKLIVLKGQKHFSLGDSLKFKKLPIILEILGEK